MIKTKHALAVNIQAFTRLPIRVIDIAGKLMPDVIIRTPHKGDVTVSLTMEHYPFIFGSVTQTDKHFDQLRFEIRAIESEATDHLFRQWEESQVSK